MFDSVTCMPSSLREKCICQIESIGFGFITYKTTEKVTDTKWIRMQKIK